MRNRFASLLFLLVAVSAACSEKNSVLRVSLSPSDVTTLTMLACQTIIGAESRTINISSSDGQPIDLTYGTSYTVEIDPKYAGPVDVFVAGLDDAGAVLLNGGGSLGELKVGELNDLLVVWQ